MPLEICFETDMTMAMCGEDLVRGDCTDYMLWFVSNVLVDMWFIVDVSAPAVVHTAPAHLIGLAFIRRWKSLLT